MSNKIGVLVGKNNETGTIYESGIIRVYIKEEDKWNTIDEIIFNMNTSEGMQAIHKRVEKLIENLGDCKIFVGKRVEGVPYTILKKAGFTIVEADGSPKEFLDELLGMVEDNQKKKKEKEEAAAKSENVEPVELDEKGYYFIDLEKVQDNNPSMSSKKVLLPFLKNKTFYELKVSCNHVPPWLENGLKELNMNMTVDKVNGVYEVNISHMICNE